MSLPFFFDKNGNPVATPDSTDTEAISLQKINALLNTIVGNGGGGTSISLTTNGSSGAATLTGGVLNIPVYSSGGGSGVVSFNTRTGAVTLTAADVNSVGTITNNTSGSAGSVPANALTGTLTSAQLLAYLTDATGTGPSVFSNNATLVAPALGTPASGVVTNLTGTGAFNTTGNATHDGSGNTITSTYAPLASPALTGTPTAPTPALADSSTKLATTAFVAANAASLANANTFTADQTAPGFVVMTGPVNNLAYWMGDSRVAGVGVSANAPNTVIFDVPGSAYNSTPIPSAAGCADGFAGHFQNSTFGYNMLVANSAVQGTGVESAIIAYNNPNGFNNTVTAIVTAGSLSITSVSPTTGLTGTMSVGGPGIPLGMTATIAGSTVTLVDPTGWSRKPSISGSLTLVFATGLPFSGALSSSMATYSSLSFPNAYQASPSINTCAYTCTVVNGSTTVTLNTGAWALEKGSAFTSTHYAAGTTVVSCTSTTAVLSNPASGAGATEVCTYVPLRFAFLAVGINDCQTIALNGSCTNGSPTYTFTVGAYIPFVGESISGTGIPASATLGSLTISGTTATATIFVSGSPSNFTGSTGTVSITYTPNSTAWLTAFTALVNNLTGVGYTVVPITPVRAWAGVDSTNETFRSAISTGILALASASVFPVDMAGLSAFSTANQQTYSIVDYLHLSMIGNSIGMEYVNSQLMNKYPALLTPTLASPLNQVHSIPWDNVTPPPGGYDITAPANNVTIPMRIRPFSGTSTRIIIGAANDFIQNDSGGIFKFGSSNTNFATMTPTGTSETVSLYFPVTVSGTTQAMAINTRYIANNASLVTLTLPSTAVVDSFLTVNGLGAGGWTVAQNASQVIHMNSSATTTGTGGSLASTNQWNCVTLRCVVANTTWVVESSSGTFTIT